jgi:hypothetical protein
MITKHRKKNDSPPNPPCLGAGVPGYANTVSLLTGAKRYSPLVEGVEEGVPVRITAK